MREKWIAYLNYLVAWAEDHKGTEYYGCSPACFDEWADSEGEEN